jgi:hypothetical protein
MQAFLGKVVGHEVNSTPTEVSELLSNEDAFVPSLVGKTFSFSSGATATVQSYTHYFACPTK